MTEGTGGEARAVQAEGDGHSRRQLRRRTARGVGWMGLSTGLQAFLQVLVLAVLARLLDPKQFGLVAGAIIAVYFTTVLAESGVGAAIVQRRELTRDHVRVGFTVSVVLGVACWAVLALLAPGLEDLLRLPGLTAVLRVVAVVLIVNNLTVGDYLLARRLQFGRLALAESLAYAVGYGGVAICLAFFGFGAWSIVGGQLGQSAVRLLMLTGLAPHSVVPLVKRGPLRDLLGYGGGYSIGRIASWAASQMDNLVVSRYLGAAALGLYGRAYQLVQMPANLVGQVANEVLFPAMASVQDDRATLRRVFALAIGAMAALALPISLVAAVTSKGLVRLLLGEGWLPLRAAFDVIIFGLLFRTSSKLTDSMAKATGAVYRRAWRAIVFAVCVFTGALVGQHWGLHGVAVGVLIALGINYVLTCHLCMSLVDMRWRELLMAHVPAVLLSLVAGGVALGAEQGLQAAGTPSVPRLLAVWGLAVLACLALIRLSGTARALHSLALLVGQLLGYLPKRATRPVRRMLGSGFAAVNARPRIGPAVEGLRG